MPQIFQNDFSGGWRPSDDSVNGPKNCLLRMQNVKLDELGSLTLVPGSQKVNDFSFTELHSLYSKIINGTEYYFSTDLSGQSYVGTAPNIFNTAFNGGGSAVRSAFGSAYNSVLCCSGGKNSKFLPASTLYLMGTAAPVAPVLSVNNPYTKDMTGTVGSYTALEGTVAAAGGYVQVTPDTTTLVGVANFIYGSSTDTTNLSSSSIGLDTDLFSIVFKSSFPIQIDSITVIFKDNADIKNYFSFTWKDTEVNFNVGIGIDGKAECTRGDFVSVGQPLWTTIKQVVVSVVFKDDATTTVSFKDLIFAGGSLGSLDGDYEYIQVLASSTAFQPYEHYGDPSPIAKISPHAASVGVVVVSPGGGTGFDETHVYRRGGGLDKFYLVKRAVGNFTDQLSDQDALLIGITLDERLRSFKTLTDPIYEIVGPFFNRWLYFTTTAIYISLDGNPENYVLGAGVLTPYGATGEVFLWAQKFGNSAILIGTTNDIYELTGTMTELPDGTIDAFIRPTGCKNPPISIGCGATANELYYISSDGVRVVSPSGNAPFWPELDLLFKGKTRYGMIPPKVNGGNIDKHILAISKNELYYSFVDTNGLRKMFAYDLLKKYGYEFKSDDGGYGAPVTLFTKENGSLIASFADSGNQYVRILNTGTLIDGITNPAIYLRTKVYNGDTPRQRKDSYTLKLKIDTGASGIEIRVYLDESSTYISLGFINTGALQEKFIDLSSIVGICKSYQLEIAGNCPSFKLTDFSIDYELRPIPLSYYRSQPTNFGMQGRKRIYEMPIVIDTLSSPVTLTPYIDGVAQTPVNFTTAGKITHSVLFNPCLVGTDYFYTLLATGTEYFEFYNDVQPRVIEPLPDAVTQFIIPNTNLGTYARKRFIAFAFVVDTNNGPCTFTPIIDGVSGVAKSCVTFDKRTYIYYFDSRTEGIDIGGTLTSNGTNTFEYFGVSLDECVSEKLPPSCTYMVIPNNNFGNASKKRIRTIPLVLDTRGFTVNYTPKVDGVSYPTQNFGTTEKTTVLYYFVSDAFGIDVGGILDGHGNNFEFYGLGQPENVEVIPVGKLFDQLGPIEFLRSANIKGFRVRMIATGSVVTYNVYVDDVLRDTGNITTFANIDKTYEIPWVKKYLNGTTCRIELSSSFVFHRISSQIRVNIVGGQTQGKWTKI